MNLICSCCAGNAPSRRQWFNQDTGYGVCPRCFNAEVEKMGRQYAIDCYGRPGVHHSTDQAPVFFDIVLSTHTPYSSHETDLYIPDTDKTRKMLEEFPLQKSIAERFTNQVEGGIWIDIPFAYIPEWDRKTRHATKGKAGE